MDRRCRQQLSAGGSTYFETIGTPCARSAITRQERRHRSCAVVDEGCPRFFAGEDSDWESTLECRSMAGRRHEIGGVVRHKLPGVGVRAEADVFLPFTQITQYCGSPGDQRRKRDVVPAQSIQLRVKELRKATRKRSPVLAEIKPRTCLGQCESYSEQVAVQFNRKGLIARLTASSSLLCDGVASVGLYERDGLQRDAPHGRLDAEGVGPNRRNVVMYGSVGALNRLESGLHRHHARLLRSCGGASALWVSSSIRCPWRSCLVLCRASLVAGFLRPRAALLLN